MNSVPKSHGMDMGRMDIKYQLRRLETEAYHAVLMAFVAQSDTISWEKEGLITELRKELHVSDSEHREFLAKINSNISVKMIRDWRKGLSNVQEPDYGGKKIPRSAGNTQPKNQQAAHSAGRRQPSQRYASHQEIDSADRAYQQYASHGKSFSSAQCPKYASHGGPYSSGSKYQKYASNVEPSLPTQTSQYTSHAEPYLAPQTSQGYASHGQLHSAAGPTLQPEQHRLDMLGKLFIFPTGKSGKSLSIVQTSSGSKGGTTGKSHSNDFCKPNDGDVRKKSGLLRIWETKKLLLEVEKMVYAAEYPDPMVVEKAKLILEEHERTILDVLAEISNVSDEDNPPNQVYPHYYNKQLQGTW